MTFQAPERLVLLLAVVALAAVYVAMQRRRRHYAVRFTNLELLASVAPKRPGWRRHVPAAAMALAAAGLIVGLAHPVTEVRVPKESATVMLVVDTSFSMNATDVEPDRLRAAADAGQRFVEGLPDRLLVGLVTFDRATRVVASPTDDHAIVSRALDQVVTGPGTAAGEGIYAALESIRHTHGDEEPGKERTAAIVLLSDGVTTVGRPVEEAAAAAAEQGVPVTTIAFGTDSGSVMVQGQFIPVPADPETMSAVAEMTGGRFFEAFSAGELRSVYDDISSRVAYDVEHRDIGMRFVAVAAVLLFLALLASMVWTGRFL